MCKCAKFNDVNTLHKKDEKSLFLDTSLHHIYNCDTLTVLDFFLTIYRARQVKGNKPLVMTLTKNTFKELFQYTHTST